MNILYYDKRTSVSDLYDLWEHVKTLFPEGELLFLPNSVQLLTDVSAEQLFSIGERISAALAIIKEERPEEYKAAYNKQIAVIRDEQWKKMLNKN